HSSPQVNLLDLLAFLLLWRKFILTGVISVTVAVGIISFLVTPRFRSTAVIRSHESSGPGIGALIASKLGALGGLASFAPTLGQVPEETYVSILKSRWLNEQIVDTLHLRSVYQMEDEPIEDVIKVLKARTDFQLDNRTYHIIMYAEDKDPKLAQRIVECFVDGLDRRNRELKTYSATKEKEFIGARLHEERARLTSLEDSMSRFQIETGILNVEEQVKATLQAVATLEAQRLTTQTEMEINARIMGQNSPELNYLKIKLASIEETLNRLVKSKIESGNADFLLHMEDTPEKGMVYLRLMRDIEIQQLLVAYLVQQHEQAKIDELRNTPTLMRLDPPTLSTIRIWPRRGFMVVIAAVGAFVFSAAFALFLEFLKKASTDPTHPSYSRMQSLIQNWRGKSV
ncbi:hypothetical protein EHM69_08580, partial [candidate division KSB1 bacterium]